VRTSTKRTILALTAFAANGGSPSQAQRAASGYDRTHLDRRPLGIAPGRRDLRNLRQDVRQGVDQAAIDPMLDVLQDRTLRGREVVKLDAEAPHFSIQMAEHRRRIGRQCVDPWDRIDLGASALAGSDTTAA